MPMPANTVSLGLALSRQLATQMRHRAKMPPVDNADARRKFEAVRTYDRLGQVYFFESDGVAIGYAVLKALNLAETLPISAERARLYASTTLALGTMGRSSMAQVYQTAALDTLAQIDDPISRIWVLEVLSIYNSGQGNWQQVERWLDEAIALCDQHNDERRKDECRSILAVCNFHQGRIETTQATWKQIFADASHRNDTQMQYWSAYGIIDMAQRKGELEEIGGFLPQVAEIESRADRNDATTEITNYGVRALLAIEQGDQSAAFKAIQAGLVIANGESPTSFSMLEGYVNLIEACYQLIKQADYHSDQLNSFIPQLVNAIKRLASAFPIGKPAAALCEGLMQLHGGNDKAAMRSVEKGLSDAAQLAMPYEKARLLALQGLIGDNASDTEQAKQIFLRLGAAHEIERWRSLRVLGSDESRA